MTTQKIVDCIRNGQVIASYKLGYETTIGPSATPDLIATAKENLINEELVKPPFDWSGIDFKIRSG